MAQEPQNHRVLVIDVGGTNVKLIATDVAKRIKIPSDPHLSPEQLVAQVLESTRHWDYEVISLGCPCVCKENRPINDPRNLGVGWNGFDFEKAFKMPTKVMNDAAMQAIGSYAGGSMLFLGFGTGLGTTFIKNHTVIPLEGGHLPYRKGRSFEDYVGKVGKARLGDKKWNKHVQRVIRIFSDTFNVDDVVLGGGNAKEIEQLATNMRRVDNHAAFKGGFRLWEENWSIS